MFALPLIAPWRHARQGFALAALAHALAAMAAPPAPDTAAKAAATPAAAVAPATPQFDIWEYAIEGNSVLPVAAIEAAVTPHLGPGKDMKAVEEARAALEQAYQKAGYLTVFVDIPEQRVDEGVVRLAATEGRVGALYVLGSRYHDQGRIKARTPELAPGQVPNFNQVQAQLDALNRTPERRITPVMRPGIRPGTVDVELQVSDELPVSGSLELNNQHAMGTEPLRLVANLRRSHLFDAEHTAALMLQTAPQAPAQSKVLVASYTLPTGDGASLVGSFSYSNSNIAALGGTQVLGRGTTAGLRHYWPLGTGATTVGFGADVKRLEESIVFGPISIDTPLRYMPFTLSLDDNWDLGFARVQWSSALVFALEKIMRREVPCPLANGVMGMVDQFACKRQQASGSFVSFKWDARMAVPLPEPVDMLGQLALRWAGQYAPAPLVSAEQFALGGAQTVRGYPESAALGDQGMLASIEWRLPDQRALFGEPLRSLTPLFFVDAGRTEIAYPGVGQNARTPLLGAGAGLRFGLGAPAGLSADGAVDVAWPFKLGPTAPTRSATWHARMTLRF